VCTKSSNIRAAALLRNHLVRLISFTDEETEGKGRKLFARDPPLRASQLTFAEHSNFPF
jgi:hypothetical protein